MADARPAPALRPDPPRPSSIVDLVRAGTLDAELAATLWLLFEGRVPCIVAGPQPEAGASVVLGALLDFLPSGTRTVELAGAGETFDWLPQASELGWARGPASSPGHRFQEPVRADTTVLLVPEFSDRLTSCTWGEEARIAVRAASIGYGLAATIRGDALSEVLDALRRPPVALTDDELSRIGVVLIVRPVEGSEASRVVAAHYVRPVARDEHGHVQRLAPAVLATWDAAQDRFEHFGWGITPELARRVGRRAGDFEQEVDRRREFLGSLASSGVTDRDALRAAIEGFGRSADAVATN